MPWIVTRSDELYHHGILGQKWGERNGPPYPLNNSRRSSAEKKQNLKSYSQLEKDFPVEKYHRNVKLKNRINEDKGLYRDEIEEYLKLEDQSASYSREDHRYFSDVGQKIENDAEYKKAFSEYFKYMDDYAKNPPYGKTAKDLYKDSKYLDLEEKEINAYVEAEKRIVEDIWNKNGKRINYLRNKVSENDVKQKKILNDVAGKVLNNLGYENTDEGRDYIGWEMYSLFYDD